MPTRKYRYVIKYISAGGKPCKYYCLARDEDHATAQWYLAECSVGAKFLSVAWRDGYIYA